MQIEKGELYGLIGPNGAGKTTVFNLLTGVYKPNEGIIKLDGEDITGKKTIDINKAGIARTFQNIRLFKQLSVLDNVKVGLHNHYKYSTLEGILRLPKYKKSRESHGREGYGNPEGFLILTVKQMCWQRTFHMVSRESWRLPVLWQQSRNFFFWTSQPQV